ncbi:E3 ubiquitin-protein ligase TRIM39-like [Tachysurus fulvidraco]|uniref:E3 ubiquitin-protein ligase TRIM39-like n=1 Tax=Tachysurus fulvidraco TaxID=1234273 RepID=UPI001FEE4A9D|nr:E3 ubiquitin-protein ligase TRIM39-like [Tachysurus fulvidraco]
MASYSSLLSEDQLLCSICLDVFTDPVTTPCGHNFCKNCLAGYWDSSDHYQCPLCNKAFKMRPDMSINTLISVTAAQFKQSVKINTADKNACTSSKMLCDACTGVKLSSVKSCLNCGASYCKAHLQPHRTIQNLKKHKLINPVENLEDYICQKHERALELFCRDDQTCVCQFCTETDHKNHNTVPIEEANDELKACLMKTQTEVQQMIQNRLEKTEEIERSLLLSKKSTEEEISQGTEVFTALIRSIERSQAELLEVMEEKQKAAERQAEGLIKELKQEISVLKRRDTELEQLSHTEEHLHLLQIYSSMCSPPHTKNWTGISINTDLSRKTLRKSLSDLRKELNNEMDKKKEKLDREKKDCDLHRIWLFLYVLLLLVPFLIPATKAFWIRVYAVDVTLDPDTAYPYLILSEDGKQVRIGQRSWKFVPYSQKRFMYDPHVLAKQGFNSGRFYYEVQVRGKTEWDLGVARMSISRQWKFFPKHNDRTWAMIKRNGKDYQACAGSCVGLPRGEEMEVVGVFVDYEEGLVSFYDAKARSLIYSITGQSFTEKLYPFFSPGLNFNYENSAPMIISEVNEYLILLRKCFSMGDTVA